MKEKRNLRLKNKRIKAGLTLYEVSLKNKFNLSQQSLIKYEQGKVIPKVDILEDLCNIYKCDINYILYGSDNTNIIIDKNDLLITIRYLLSTNMLCFNGNYLEIKDNNLKSNIIFLNIYNKNVKISSLEDIYVLIDGIKKMEIKD